MNPGLLPDCPSTARNQIKCAGNPATCRLVAIDAQPTSEQGGSKIHRQEAVSSALLRHQGIEESPIPIPTASPTHRCTLKENARHARIQGSRSLARRCCRACAGRCPQLAQLCSVNWLSSYPPKLSCKEFERLGHEVRVELEHRAMSGIGIDDEIAIRKPPRQIIRVLAWNHAIAVAVCDKHGLVNL